MLRGARSTYLGFQYLLPAFGPSMSHKEESSVGVLFKTGRTRLRLIGVTTPPLLTTHWTSKGGS